MTTDVSSQWFAAQDGSPAQRDGGGEIPGAKASGAHASASPRDGDGEIPLQGLAVDVSIAPCLAIENTIGCNVYVLAGKAWITAVGTPRDIIADAGTTVPLERGVRFNVSGFRDVATVLISVPGHRHGVVFSLQERDGMRVVAVTAGSGRLPVSLSELSAALLALARRGLAAKRTAKT